MLKKSSFEMIRMTLQQSGIHIVQPSTSTHHPSERARLIGKPRFHFEPSKVMQLLRERIIGQDAATAVP